jgi:hypothetical protein
MMPLEGIDVGWLLIEAVVGVWAIGAAFFGLALLSDYWKGR